MNTTNNNITGILLAAGRSRRFGSNKLLENLGNKPMISIAAQKLKAVLPNSIAVIPPNDSQLKMLIKDEGLDFIECDDASNGIGASLACGIRSSKNAAGWLITLADMPFIKRATMEKVIQTLENGAAISIPQSAGRKGHPVGLSQQYKDHLLKLNNDLGARDVINHHQHDIAYVNVDDPGIHIDIDTLEDIYAIQNID